jgi:hypothetical protein
MFCAPGRVFDGTEGVGSRFRVLRVRTRFRRYRARRVSLLCSALPNSFLAVPKASGLIFLFYAPGLLFSGVECVGSHFPVKRGQTSFRRYQGRRVPFSYLTHPDSFSAVPRASDPVFMFSTPGLIFYGTEGVTSRFHVLHARTRFWCYRGRRVPFSCFALPDSFSAVSSASGPFFMFCAPELIFGGTEGVGSRFDAGPRASGTVFMFCAPKLVFGGTDGVGTRFHVLRSRTRFRLSRVRQVPF